MQKTMVKPCPFCGEMPRIIPWHGSTKRKRAILCRANCDVGPMVTGGTLAVAARRWNGRVPGKGARLVEVSKHLCD